MGSHSIIAPSSAARRVQCRGSAVMELTHPDTGDKPEAAAGTAAHELAEWMIDECRHARFESPTWAEVAARGKASNGVEFTREMYDAARIYADDVSSVMRATGVFGGGQGRDGGHFAIEERTHSPAIHAECWGTLDARIYHSPSWTLYLWDFKYGHLPVDAFENWQLIEYASGVMDRMDPQWRDRNEPGAVEFRVVAPRNYDGRGPVRVWRITTHQLLEYEREASRVEHEALGPDPEHRVGPLCKTCTGRHACATLQRAAYDAAAYADQGGSFDLDDAALGTELLIVQKAIEALEARKDGLQAQAETRIRSGHNVAGWSLRDGKGRARWNDDVTPATLFAIGDGLGVDLRKSPDPEPVTPVQAKQRGIDEAVINAYSYRPHTGMKLVMDNSNEARKVFS